MCPSWRRSSRLVASDPFDRKISVECPSTLTPRVSTTDSKRDTRSSSRNQERSAPSSSPLSELQTYVVGMWRMTYFISRFTAIFTFFIVICLTFLPTFIMKALINDLSSEEGDPNYLGIHSFCLFSIHRHYYSLDLHCGFLGGPHCGCLRYQSLSNAPHPNWCPDEVHGFGSPLSQGPHSQLNGKGQDQYWSSSQHHEYWYQQRILCSPSF